MSMVRGQDALFGILVQSINPHFIISLIFFSFKKCIRRKKCKRGVY